MTRWRRPSSTSTTVRRRRRLCPPPVPRLWPLGAAHPDSECPLWSRAVNGSKSELDVRGMTAEQILQRIHMDTILIAHKDDIDGVERDGIDDGPEDA